MILEMEDGDYGESWRNPSSGKHEWGGRFQDEAAMKWRVLSPK